MSIDRKRWAQRAQELKFTQLDSARKQAEGWRVGLSGLTALLGTALIVKGRDNITSLTPGFRWGVVILLGVALTLLVTATLLAIRASSGMPDENILLSGESLRSWTLGEVGRISIAIRRATWLATLGVACLTVAIGSAWLGPVAKPTTTPVDVRYEGGRKCGELTSADRHNLILDDGTRARPVNIPLSTVIAIHPVRSCK